MIVFPEVDPGEAVVVSGSTYVAYRNCPEQAVGRLRGEYGEDSVPGFVGNLAHRVFARHLRDGPIPAGDLDQACREEIGGGLNPKLGSLGMKPSTLRPVIAEVGDLYEKFRRVTLEGCTGVEVALEAEPAEGVVVKGIVDAVFTGEGGGPVLRDWKTGQIGDVSRQLSFYGMLWALVHGETPERLDAYSVATGERYEETPTRDGLQATAADVARFVSIARRSFAGEAADRTAGPWCRYCPQLPTCTEGSSAMAVLD